MKRLAPLLAILWAWLAGAPAGIYALAPSRPPELAPRIPEPKAWTINAGDGHYPTAWDCQYRLDGLPVGGDAFFAGVKRIEKFTVSDGEVVRLEGESK